MEQIEIYFNDNSELAEFEAIQKGFRLDVYVRINNSIYNIKTYDIIRLKQDFEDEVTQEGYYSIDSNLVLVKQVSREDICYTLENLFKEKYFDELKTLTDVDINKLTRIR